MQFQSDDELIRYVQERSDDIDEIQLVVADSLRVTGPQGQQVEFNDSCALLRTCDGGSLNIGTEDLQKVLDNGILQRMNIRIRLVPLGDK